MSKVSFITGGQRSGKSSFAMQKALELTEQPVYIATSRIWDDDFKNRVDRHKRDRTENWINIEEEKELSKHNLTGKTIVLDCITLWLTNFFSDNNFDVDKSLEEAKNSLIRILLSLLYQMKLGWVFTQKPKEHVNLPIYKAG